MRQATVRITMVVAMMLAGWARAGSDELEGAFTRPPEEARPWTYWFWINGNITREGITADLEAMHRVGIGGVLIMEVAGPNFAPEGEVEFASPRWRELFKHVVAEARRLGMRVTMNNDAGWTGSGGPWVTPEKSVKKLAWTTASVTGPGKWNRMPPRPVAEGTYYDDVKVLAYPEGATTVKPEEVVDLTGKSEWEVPAGKWVVMRIGQTSNGVTNKPAPKSGTGLECDKFDASALQLHFDSFIGKLAEDNPADVGRTLAMTHIDSWEVGGQDWADGFGAAFRQLRGYDPTPWLVMLAKGPALGDNEQVKRFQRDYLHTKAQVGQRNYARAMRAAANKQGMALSFEAYNGEFVNPLTYAAESDLPMGEFWVTRWGAWHLLSSRLMASVANTFGKPIVGAEAFTSIGVNDPWTEHPYSLKTTGDWAYTEGINRFVFHRTALQPWTQAGMQPGMSFSGFGTHFDREQTWWETGAPAFMEYLSRCQAVLQRGRTVTDVCRLLPDGEVFGHRPNMVRLAAQYETVPVGYDVHYVSDQAVMDGTLSVKDGRIISTGGASYRVMQLPNGRELTPDLLAKVRDLVKAGAVVVGPRTETSPSLRGYPQCDEEVRAIAAEVWGDCDGKAVRRHTLGKGEVVWGEAPGDVLNRLCGGAEFSFKLSREPTDEFIMSVTMGRGSVMGKERQGLMPTAGLNWIHRRDGEADVYFLANPQHRAVEAICTFRDAQGRRPELWDPATGEVRDAAVFTVNGSAVRVPIHFESAASVFVVFREAADRSRQVVAVRRDGGALFGGDARGPEKLPVITFAENGKIRVRTSVPGSYELTLAEGGVRTAEIARAGEALAVDGPWEVRFQAGRGAPESATFDTLVDWSKHEDAGVRYFSGTATYRGGFEWKSATARGGSVRRMLDLGDVQVIAGVKVNGKDVGVWWKPPFTVDVTDALREGRNEVEIRVTNLWPNRLIGDERFPDDCTPDGKWTRGPLRAWPEWVVKGEPRPEQRRVTFTTWKYYDKTSPLLPSGLIGPVQLRDETVAEAQ